MSLEDEAKHIQRLMRDHWQHGLQLQEQRKTIFLNLYRQGWTARQIAKLVDLNHSVVYKILERAGYEPEYSFKAAHMRKQAQRAIVHKTQARMAAKAKQYV